MVSVFLNIWSITNILDKEEKEEEGAFSCYLGFMVMPKKIGA